MVAPVPAGANASRPARKGPMSALTPPLSNQAIGPGSS
eukprot:CAMPEP_0179319316 /NCGR_PEP_ID=MMETSP0797-20121207/57410_1 /TAXON_ID=47934 /ORGANISM="Dinophysis acuminata, Strain DAEP01" /LENGTH=37 /DNA_ID= /DNA_START= /DNA_END= /DNA_ORIENTATION=